jgi:hypothetical protein
VYHYRVKSRDAAGNLAVSGDFTFTTRDSTLPTVSMTAPAAGSTVGGTVTVSASATDNVGVVGVQFKLDGVDLGPEDPTFAPYQRQWNTRGTSDGTHTLTVVARDAAGNTATSSAVSVTVDNAPPLLSTAVSTNISSSAATIIWMTSEAADSQVEYGKTSAYGQVTTLASALVSSHSVGLSGLAESTVYHYRVKSRDAAGNLAVSGDLTFTTRDSTLPTVSMTAPAAGAPIAGTVTVTASATDNVGVVGLQFKLDGVNLGADVTAAPYTLAWITTTAANGTHTLTAVARDAAGNSATAAGVSVTVDNDTTPPTVSMTAPAAGSTVGGTVTVSASATDNVGVVGVQFKLDGANLGAELNTAPFFISWNTALAANGAHTLTAVARDAAGHTATAVAVSMTVFNDTAPPTVSMIAPAAGSNVAGTVTVSASATDNVGVVGIQFKLDGVNLGAELTAVPYFLSWNTTTATNGAHALTAVARDAAGNVTTSSGVSVTVANLTLSILAPLNGATLTDLTKVKVQAASDIGLSSVLVFSDSTLIGTLSCASNPCLSLASTVDWTTTGLVAGPHYLYAVATDTLGNTSSSALITVIK